MIGGRFSPLATKVTPWATGVVRVDGTCGRARGKTWTSKRLEWNRREDDATSDECPSTLLSFPFLIPPLPHLHLRPGSSPGSGIQTGMDREERRRKKRNERRKGEEEEEER